MNRLISISITSSILLMAGSPIHDLMDSRIKGKSYSGTLDDNVAAEDGLGVLPLQSYGTTTDVNNELLVQKVFNKIVKSESDKTKTVNIRTSLTNGVVGTVSDFNLITNAGVILNQNGTSCNSDLTKTGMTYLNGICQGGTYINGTTCNDNDADTINDIYTNNTCKGIYQNLELGKTISSSWKLITRVVNGSKTYDIGMNYTLANSYVTNKMLVRLNGRFVVLQIDDPTYPWFNQTSGSEDKIANISAFDSLYGDYINTTTSDGTGNINYGIGIYFTGHGGIYLYRTQWTGTYMFWNEKNGLHENTVTDNTNYPAVGSQNIEIYVK